MGSIPKITNLIEELLGKRFTKKVIIDYYKASAKKPEDFLIGAEVEKIGVYRKTGESVPYFGDMGYLKILEKLNEELGWKIEEKNNNSILEMSRSGTYLTLESDGRVELTSKTHTSIHDLAREFRLHQNEINEISSIYGVTWLGIGFHPFSKNQDLETIPKKRIKISNEYLKNRGKLGSSWSRRTASIQVAIDYSSEEDAVKKFKILVKLTPILIAMYANSPLMLGKKTKYLSYRGFVANNTDKARFGSFEPFFAKNFNIDRWVEFCLDIPLVAILRKGEWIDFKNTTFRQFMKKGCKGQKAVFEDWLMHLSFIYTDVRFKNYLEFRACDSVPPHLVPSLPALLKGLFYDKKSLAKVEEMVKDWNFKEVKKLRTEVNLVALNAEFRKKKVLEYAKELLEISTQGLENINIQDIDGHNESIYLEPLKELIMVKGMSPASFALDNWEGDWHGEISKLTEWCAY